MVLRRETGIWTVAFVSAVVSQAVDRAADFVFEQPQRTTDEFRDLAELCAEMEGAQFKEAERLLKRRRPEYNLSITCAQERPPSGPKRAKWQKAYIEEQSLFHVLGFFEIALGLLAVGAMGAPGFAGNRRRELMQWLERLTALASRKPCLDTRRHEQIDRAIAALEELLDGSTANVSFMPVELEAVELRTLGGNGSFQVVGCLYNPNPQARPIPAVRVKYADAAGRIVGHRLVWPNGVFIEGRTRLCFQAELEGEAGVEPIAVDEARSVRDFVKAFGLDARFPGTAPLAAPKSAFTSVRIFFS